LSGKTFLFKISAMKKSRHPDIKVGIWLDQEKAFIIRIEGDTDPVMEKIKSDVESRIRTAGEGKVSARFGQSFIDDQEKKQKRQRHQRHRYFKEIIGHIQDADYVGIFGPGKAREELNNVIEADGPVKDKVVTIEPADKITKSQMMALVRNYFNSESFLTTKKGLKKGRKGM